MEEELETLIRMKDVYKKQIKNLKEDWKCGKRNWKDDDYKTQLNIWEKRVLQYELDIDTLYAKNESVDFQLIENNYQVKAINLNRGDCIIVDNENYIVESVYQDGYEYCIKTLCKTSIFVGFEDEIAVIIR